MASARPVAQDRARPPDFSTRLGNWLRRTPTAAWAIGFFLLILPAFANDFILVQIFGWSFILGMIALSLMFLAGYGGMVSLMQMSISGVAGYMVAILGPSRALNVRL